MKWIGRRHKKSLRRTYCTINGMSPIVTMMQPRASNNRHLQIWGAPEAWSHIRISNENAKFIHFQVRWSLFRKCHMISYDRSSTAYVPITFSKMWYSSTYVWVWDTARLFVAKWELWHPYDRSSGAPELQPWASKCCGYATNIRTQVLNLS